MLPDQEKAAQWPYGDAFQVKVLAHCLKDSTFLPRHNDVIMPSYFQREQLNALAYLITSYFKKYQSVPTYEALSTQVTTYVSTYGGDRAPEMFRDLTEWMDAIYQLELTDGDFIHDKAIEFGRRQALKKAIAESLTSLENPKAVDFVDIQSNFDGVFQLGAEKDFGVDWHEIAPKLPVLLNEDTTYGRKYKVPTGFISLDQRLSGGMGAGEIAIIAGPPGKGKSTFLVNLGKAASRHFKEKANDKVVVHVTLELKQPDISLMYSSCVTGVPRNDVITSAGEYDSKLARFAPLFAHIRIKYFSPGSISTNDLKWWLVNMQSIDKVTPGLIIVDYADKLKGGESDRYRGMGEIYTSLIAIGDRFQCPIWTGSQINREWSEEETITGKGLADSFQKKMDADLVITLNQTMKEHENKICRLYLDKVRRGEGQGMVWCNYQKDKAVIWEMTPEELELYKTRASGAEPKTVKHTGEGYEE